MKSICFFSSFYTTPRFPGYVRFYLTELKRHFSEEVFLTNQKDIQPDDLKFLRSLDISYKLYKNEGFDFGMWYKAFLEYNVEQYDQIGLVNDSCLLFKKLDFFFEWLKKENPDYAGMSDSSLIKFHIQSYFIIINKNAIMPVADYFKRNGIIENFKEVIKIYEVGLCQYLINSGLKLQAYYSVISENYTLNPVWYKIKSLIREGFPMIKKKIIIRSFEPEWGFMIPLGFDPYPNHYIKLIKEVGPDIDIKEMLSGLTLKKTFKEGLVFHATVFIYKAYGIYKKIYYFAYNTIRGIYRAIFPRQSLVCLCILTWNRPKFLELCIDDLLKKIFYHHDCRVLIMDNGSTDETEKVLEKYRGNSCVKIIRSEKHKGLNAYKQLFKKAKSKYIIEVDDDVLEFPVHFDKVMLEYMDAYPDYGYLALNVVQNEFTNGAKPDVSHYTDDVRGDKVVQRGPTGGWCSCFRKRDFNKIRRSFNKANINFKNSEDCVLEGYLNRWLKLKAGIIKNYTCFHATGPHYAKKYGHLEREIKKYSDNQLDSFVEHYKSYLNKE